MRQRPKPLKPKPKRPVAPKSPKNQSSRVRDLEKRLTEALDQQTATSEILRVISSSPTDVQPVFDTIARNAVRLCEATRGSVNLLQGEWIRHVGRFPREGPIETHVSDAPNGARVIREGAIFHVPDTESDSRVTPEALRRLRSLGARAFVSVPMKQDFPIGSITVYRSTPGGFPQNHVALLQTFADQAVIAIENVRLFNETKEALEQQTATSEILAVISQSPTDVQPVFDAIVSSAVRLCDGLYGSVARFDGQLIHSIAQYNYSPEAVELLRRTFPIRPGRAFPMGRAIMDCAVAQIPDIERDPQYEGVHLARAVGARSVLVVPMLHNGKPIGGILVARAEVGPFSDKQIELLRTFADQAVIAIENGCSTRQKRR